MVHLEQRAPVALVVLARIDRILAPLTWVAAAFAVLLLFVGPAIIGAKDDGATARTPAAAAAAPSGKEVFSSAGCGGCHTLAAAGSSGTPGPNLDDAKPSADTVERIVTSGSGTMPSFKGRLSAAEIKAVAQFVSGTEPTTKATAPPTGASARQPSVAATVRVGRGPDGITVAGSDVWVADASAGTLLRVDAGSNRRAGAALPAGRQPDHPVVAANGAVWVVASGDDAVLRIMNGRTTSVPVGRAPEALAAGERFLWVTNAGDGTVSRIDPETARVSGDPIKVGGRPLDIAAGEDAVWVTSFTDGTVTRLDPGSGDVQGEPIKVGRRPRGVAVGEGSTWVANAGDGTITRIDPARAAVVGDPIPVGRNPRELEVGEGFVWVANAGDGTVTRIDPSGKVAGEPIEVGENPIGIAVGAGAVWTANFRAGTVTRIRP